MRANRGFAMRSETPTLFDKLLCAVSYPTMGLVGFVWLIFAMIVGKPPKYFVRFNIYQSIFISILLYLASIIFNIILGLVKIIPFIGSVILFFEFYLLQYPILFGYSLIESAVLILVAYLTISSLMGRCPEIPWVSDNIKKMI